MIQKSVRLIWSEEKIKCEANGNEDRQTRLILCGAVMDEVKREVCIYLLLSVYLFNFIYTRIKHQYLK